MNGEQAAPVPVELATAGDTRWAPPPRHQVQNAGAVWDAVRVPEYLGDRALPRLGAATGAVVRNEFVHQLYWLVPPGASRTWQPLPSIRVFGPDYRIEIPPAGYTRGLRPFWAVEPRPGRLLTNAGQLHEALVAVLDSDLRRYRARDVRPLAPDPA